MEPIMVGEDIMCRNRDTHLSLLSGGKGVVVKAYWPTGCAWPRQTECLDDFEEELDSYVRAWNIDSEAALNGMDNIPYFRVDFGRMAYLMSVAYGCEIIRINGLLNTKPIINDSVDGIKRIEKLDNIHERGLYPEISRRMLMIQERFGDVGFVPSDVQSPIDVATEIVKSDVLMLAMYDEPDAVHHLLGILTESIGEIVRYQQGLVRNWVGSGHDYAIPRGIHLSDDNASFLSPGIYRDFVLPYNGRLGKAFDGVTLHCCMCYKQNLKVMSGTEGFLGFDPQITHNPLDMILDAITDRGFWRVWDMPQDRSVVDTCKELIDATDGLCGLMLEVSGPDRDSALRRAEVVKSYAASKGRA